MKILITGSEGFIGTHLKKLFDEKEIVSYDLKIGKDILNEKDLARSMSGCDAIVHLAAFTSVPQSWKDPVVYYYNNIVGTSIVLETAKKSGVKKIVFASSAATYQATSSPYGISKLTGEAILGAGRGDMSIFNLRFFNIYGEGQNPAYAGVISKFIEGTKNNQISITGDGLQTRDFISIEDICRAIKLAIESTYDGVVAMDIGTGNKITIKELAYLIRGISGSSFEINYLPAISEVRDSVADIKIAEQLLKFKSSISLIDGLKKLIEKSVILSESNPISK